MLDGVDDNTPDLFTLAPKFDVARSSEVESEQVLVSGVDVGTILVATEGCSLLVNGMLTSQPALATNGDTIGVILVSAPSFAAQTSCRVWVGDFEQVFVATTHPNPWPVPVNDNETLASIN